MSDLMGALLQSESRTRLLRLLLVEKRVGSVSELARRARLSARAIAREVDHLAQLHLVQVRVQGASRVVAAEWEHPACSLLAQLLILPPYRGPDLKQQLRESLVAHGAPLVGLEPRMHYSLEETLLRGLEAAKGDATLLRVLPVVVAKNHHQFDWLELKESARKQGLKAELGLVLDLTGSLLGDDALRQQSQDLRDHRRTRVRYLTVPRSKYERQAAEAVTPPLARSWGFLMNMSEESFRSLLAKSCPGLGLA